MEHLFQPVLVYYLDADGKRIPAKKAKDAQGRLLPGIEKVKDRSKVWYGKYRDHNRDVKRVPLSPDKSAAKSLLHELVTKAERRRAGRGDPFEEHRNKDLVCPQCKSAGKTYDRQKRKYRQCRACGPEVPDDAKHAIPHLSAYRRYLHGKKDAESHIGQTIRRIQAVFEGCKAKRLADVTGNRVMDFLSGLRDRGEWVQTVHYAVSEKTCDRYRSDVTGFCRWAIRACRDRWHTKGLVCPECASTGKASGRTGRECPACGAGVPDEPESGIPHLSAYRRHLQSEGKTEGQLLLTIGRIRDFLGICHARRLGDIQGFGDRENDRRDLLLLNLRDRGRKARVVRRMSIQTTNDYLTAVKAFCEWARRDHRTEENPLSYLSAATEAEATFERRRLPQWAFEFLVNAARTSEDVLCKMTGQDRAMLYLVAGSTGLRAGELASLRPGSLSLHGDPPTVELEAAYSKRRRHDVQPLPKWLAEQLGTWLAEKTAGGVRVVQGGRRGGKRGTAGDRLWPKTGWHKKAAEMLRRDLARARAAWIGAAATPDQRAERDASLVLSPVDEDGRVFDFHALRHQFISGLAAAGVSPKVAQQLARHSTINLTMNRYTHLAVSDVAGAVDQIPEVPPADDGRQAVRATGTDDPVDASGNAVRRAPDGLHVPRRVPTSVTQGASLVTTPPSGSDLPNDGAGSQETPKPLAGKSFAAAEGAVNEGLEVVRAGIEPATHGLTLRSRS